MFEKIVLASSSAGKLAELQASLDELGLQLLPQSQFMVEDVEENGLSFFENALIKARHAASISGLPALADDSGLIVDALNGAPGIYSARYAGAHGDDAANNAKLLREMQGLSGDQRRAHFYCALVLVRSADDPRPILAEGVWTGEIALTPRGANGFGYDPLFYVPALEQCSAELSATEKKRISHRARALQALREKLKQMLFG